MFKIAVLISGGGSNLQSIIDNIESGNISAKIEIVISDRECFGIERAKKYNIKTIILDKKSYKEELSNEINNVLVEHKIDLIVLAGFLSILSEKITSKWSKKIINIHPSLLPKYGGAGMYGLNVHRAVLNGKESESGCTVHYVDSGVDSGEIIAQKKVRVFIDDTPELLQERVLKQEHILLPMVIKEIIEKESK